MLYHTLVLWKSYLLLRTGKLLRASFHSLHSSADNDCVNTCGSEVVLHQPSPAERLRNKGSFCSSQVVVFALGFRTSGVFSMPI
jgi:hypothetical protein